MVLLGVSLLSLGTQELCYSVGVNSPDGRKEFTLNPIMTFPQGHVLTNTYPGQKPTPICGMDFQVGDPIPSEGFWANRYVGGTDTSQCAAADGATLFYAYNYPNGASSNTGFEAKDSMLVYFMVDESDTLSIVFTFDIPNDGSGGQVIMNLQAPDLAGNTDIYWNVRDDPTEPRRPDSGKATWDSTTGSIDYMRWNWVACCTDGGAMTNFPSQGFELGLEVSNMDGLNKFAMASQNPDTGEVTLEELDASFVLGSAFTIKASTCIDYCAEKADCGTCSLDPRCGWCGASGTCIKTQDAASCTADYNMGDTCCSACTAQTTCGGCTAEAGCAWDHGASQCISAMADLATTCIDPTPTWMTPTGDTECGTCPGGAWETDGTLKHWCNGNGQCNWDTFKCTCDDGWGGEACDVACPTYDGMVCGGKGTCNAAGQCECNCGYVGASCETEQCLNQCGKDDTETEAYCLVGDCSVECGLDTGDGCTGAMDGANVCVCSEGWYGPKCDKLCPGATKDGTGPVCGGFGTCDASGQCSCEGCAGGGGSNVCTAPVAPTCSNFGQAVCVNNAWACDCIGSFVEDPDGASLPNCDKNGCPSIPKQVPINQLTGSCICSQCDNSEYAVALCNATHDTICTALSPSCTAGEQFEAIPPTATSDRQCVDLIDCTTDQWQAAAPTPTSQRECRDITPCIAGQQWMASPATSTSDNDCRDASPECDLSVEYEELPLTANSDRKCDALVDCVPGQEYQLEPPSPTSNRICDPLTVCEVGKQYQVVAPTATSNRRCADATPPCDGTQDLVETLPLTPTSDRRCSVSDDCAGSPCQNGGVCIDGVLSFTCDCTGTGFAGDLCEYDDSCDPDDPCENGLCIATAQGAICECEAGWVGSCCGVEQINGVPAAVTGLVCRNITSGASAGDGNDSSASSGMPSAAIAGVIAGLLAVLMLAGVAYKSQRNARDVQDAEKALMKAEQEFVAAGGVINPRWAIGSTEPLYSDASVANGGAEHEYAESVGHRRHSVDATYEDASVTKLGGQEPVYGQASQEDAVYAMGSAAAGGGGGGDPVYDVGAAGGGDPTYDIGAASGGGNGEPIYGQATQETAPPNGAARDMYGEPTYGLASPESSAAAPEPTYGLASPESSATAPEATYGLASSETQGGAASEAIYGMATPEAPEATYGLASQASSVQPDATYGLPSGESVQPEATYGLARNGESVQPEATYGLAPNSGRAPYAVAESAYSNSADMATSADADNIYANSTEIAPGVVISNEELRNLEEDEDVDDVPDGYLSTFPARRGSLI